MVKRFKYPIDKKFPISSAVALYIDPAEEAFAGPPPVGGEGDVEGEGGGVGEGHHDPGAGAHRALVPRPVHGECVAPLEAEGLAAEPHAGLGGDGDAPAAVSVVRIFSRVPRTRHVSDV